MIPEYSNVTVAPNHSKSHLFPKSKLGKAGSVSVNTMASLNTDVMLAIVLGGMSIFGGSRSFAFTGVIGSLTVCLLNQGLLMIGVDSSIVQAVRGIIFLILIITAQQRPKGLPAPEG